MRSISTSAFAAEAHEGIGVEPGLTSLTMLTIQNDRAVEMPLLKVGFETRDICTLVVLSVTHATSQILCILFHGGKKHVDDGSGILWDVVELQYGQARVLLLTPLHRQEALLILHLTGFAVPLSIIKWGD